MKEEAYQSKTLSIPHSWNLSLAVKCRTIDTRSKKTPNLNPPRPQT